MKLICIYINFLIPYMVYGIRKFLPISLIVWHLRVRQTIEITPQSVFQSLSDYLPEDDDQDKTHFNVK